MIFMCGSACFNRAGGLFAAVAIDRQPIILERGHRPFVLLLSFTMKLSITLLLLIWSTSSCQAFSQSFCDNLCFVSNPFCWFCNSVHGDESLFPEEEARNLKNQLRPITKAEMIYKAKSAYYARQQRVVGGIPVEQGESPWTVRYELLDKTSII